MAFPLTLRRTDPAAGASGGAPRSAPQDTAVLAVPFPDAGTHELGSRMPAAGTVDDFPTRLLAVVDEQMRLLTSADALDEWHRDYLDPRIDAEVAAQQHRIDLAVDRQRRALQAQRGTLAARVCALDAALAEAAPAVRSTADELAQQVAQAAQLVGAPAASGSPAEAEALLAELASLAPVTRRAGWWSSRRRTEPELRRALAVRAQRQHEREERLAYQRQAVAEAVARRQAAEEAYRRASGVSRTPATQPAARVPAASEWTSLTPAPDAPQSGDLDDPRAAA